MLNYYQARKQRRVSLTRSKMTVVIDQTKIAKSQNNINCCPLTEFKGIVIFENTLSGTGFSCDLMYLITTTK